MISAPGNELEPIHEGFRHVGPLRSRRKDIGAIYRNLIYAVLLVEGDYDEALAVGGKVRHSVCNAENVACMAANNNAVEAFVTVLF